MYDGTPLTLVMTRLLILFQAVFKAKVKELSSTLEATQLQLAYQRQETMITCEKETTRANSLNETVRDRCMYIL